MCIVLKNGRVSIHPKRLAFDLLSVTGFPLTVSVGQSLFC